MQDFESYFQKKTGIKKAEPSKFEEYFAKKSGLEVKPFVPIELKTTGMVPSHEQYEASKPSQLALSAAEGIKQGVGSVVGPVEGFAETAMDLLNFIPTLAVTVGGAAVSGGDFEKGAKIGGKYNQFIDNLYNPKTEFGKKSVEPIDFILGKVGDLIKYAGEDVLGLQGDDLAKFETAAGIGLVAAGGRLHGRAKATYRKVLEKTKTAKPLKAIIRGAKEVPSEIKSIVENIPDEMPIRPEMQKVVKEARPVTPQKVTGEVETRPVSGVSLTKEAAEVFKRMPDDQLRQMADKGVEGAKIEVVERTVKARETVELKAQQDRLSKELTGPKEGPFKLSKEAELKKTQEYMDVAEELNVREPKIAAKDSPDPPPPPQKELPFREPPAPKKKLPLRYEDQLRPEEYAVDFAKDAYIDNAYREVVTEAQAKKQAGFVGSRKPTQTKREYVDPEIGRIFKKQSGKQFGGELAETSRNIITDAKRLVIYESTLKEHPQFKNDLRLFQDVVWDAIADKNKKIVATVGKIADSPAESRLFREYITMKSFEGMGKDGKSIPYGLKLEQVQAELASIEARMTPAVQEAIGRHRDITRIVLQDLVDRGKLPEELLGKDELYYHHVVLDYAPEWTRRANVPKRFQKPFRGYTKKRVGTKKAVDLNYSEAMGDLYVKTYIDNAIDDFMIQSVERYDFTKSIPKERITDILGKDGVAKPRRIYEIDGKEYQGYQYQPGNAYYPTEALNAKLWQQAIAEGMSVEEFMELEGPRGGKPIRKAIAMGGKHKTYLLPKEIAMRLEDFRSPAGDIPLFWNLRNATAFWKRMTLDFAGIPFQFGNMFGDLINLYKTDAAAFSKLADGFRISLKEVYDKGKLSPELERVAELAKEHRVSTTHFFSEVGVQAFDTSVLRKFERNFAPANFIGGLIEKYEKLSIFREEIARTGKFAKDLERIADGKQVKAGEIDISGLDNISAAGKVAREFTVDYGAVPGPYKRFLRGWLTPFLSFYDYNMRNWVRYATTNPGDAMVKFGAPGAAMWVWNNTGERKETEEHLGFWRYLPHVNTGYKTKEGKDIIVAMQTPAEMAFGWFGLDRLPAKITDVRSGKLTTKEAAIQQLIDVGLGAPRQIERLLNPMIQVMIGMASGKDPYSNKQIVPSRFKGTKYESRYWSEFVLGKLLTPYGQFMRIQSTAELDPDIGGFGQWLLKGPLDVVRSVGIRTVDINRYQMSEGYQEKAELTNDIKNKLAILEKRFIKANLMSNMEESNKFWEDTKDVIDRIGGAWPSAEQITNRLFGYDVQMEIAQKALGKTKDKQLRQDIKDYMESMREGKYVESMTKNSLQVIRQDLFEKAFEWMNEK